MKQNVKRSSLAATLLLAFALALAPAQRLAAQTTFFGNQNIQHVLLISIDGMHALDFINCANGISGANGGEAYCPNLAQLKPTGINYLYASTARPSDSFPGLMALVTGGSPRTVGAFYDDAYDRSLDPPAVATGDNLAGGTCLPFARPMGTTTEYDEGIDINQNVLNGGAPSGDGGINSIDPQRLPRDPSQGCAPVYPWNFVRTNTIFGVIHQAGGYTAWSDKHPSYSAVAGPGNGSNLDDYYAPEINSVPANLPGVSAGSVSCNPLPDQTAIAGDAWTDSFQNIQCYDTLKVNAILNEIAGKNHDGTARTKVPAIFGMNFQAVSVGQKLIEKTLSPTVTGGYDTSVAANAVYGTPTPSLLEEIKFVDAAIGEMITNLQNRHLLNSTLVIITAKHGQSPIDSNRYLGIPADFTTGEPPSSILGSTYLPDSEINQIGPTEDDISLLWLSPGASVTDAVNLLESSSPVNPPNSNIAGIGQIFAGPAIPLLYDTPGVPPNDPRTPDIIVAPNVGVTYSGSTKKLAEHGGFAHDDTNVMLLVSNPSFKASTVTLPVETRQIAPTVLAFLGLDPYNLDAVQIEGTEILPGLGI